MESAIEWPLVFFSLLAGAGGCTFAYVGLSEFTKTGAKSRFWITLIALIITAIGGVCSILHLASPQNVMAAVWNIGSFSGISIELIMIAITGVLMVIYLIVCKVTESHVATQVLGILGIISGLVLAFVTGHGYVLQAQETWDTEWLPIAYLGTSISLGAMIYAFCDVLLGSPKEDRDKFTLPVGIGTFIGPVTILCYIFAVGFGKAMAHPLVLWGGLIVCGVICTAICGVFVLLKRSPGHPAVMPCIGLVVAFIGSFCLRIFMWLVGTGFLELFTVSEWPRVIF